MKGIAFFEKLSGKKQICYTFVSDEAHKQQNCSHKTISSHKTKISTVTNKHFQKIAIADIT